MTRTPLDPTDVLNSPEVRAALAAWLPRQRWFAAAGGRLPRPAVVRTHTFHRAGGTAGVIALVRDEAAAGRAGGDYQVPLGVGPAGGAPPGAAVIARPGGAAVWDALADASLVGVLIAHVAAGHERDGLRFRAEPPGFRPPGPAAPVRPPGAEQTNTSVVVDERYILKVFRRVLPGPNPDLVLHRMLRDAGSRHVTPLLGSVESEGPDGPGGAPTTLATVQTYLPRAADGWELALAGAGAGDFTAEARRLGEAVAAVHRDLAAAGGVTPLGAADYAALAASFLRRLDAALAAAPRLARYAPGLRAAFAAVADLDPAAGRTAHLVHGDLHLGQTLRTADGWLLIDFEGEPLAASHGESGAAHSPLRDVAGMLRSFDYAAHHGLTGAAADATAEPRRRAAALRWAERSADAFWRGYARAAGREPAEDAALLRAYELDKAVYEVLYETRYRPAWAWIPLQFLRRALPARVSTARRRNSGSRRSR
ncbi:hypothetical protein [Streptomyces sp. MP131-18]|uniref:maltokinase N-terminal cap-like domain-containing protein n=1 Tax=Streptomyces sp. MP131-18 TaxID=1857892 RepID=UPI00097CB955|nr:hypothetical protein [Streptomyces sp. MP131-18]ONK14118.1 Maltokinase [Streptomyces sp. MP131-18]